MIFAENEDAVQGRTAIEFSVKSAEKPPLVSDFENAVGFDFVTNLLHLRNHFVHNVVVAVENDFLSHKIDGN